MTDRTLEASSYTIRMSEAQRLHIIAALSQMPTVNYAGADATERFEIDMLLGMFNDLDTVEDTHNIIHGFAL